MTKMNFDGFFELLKINTFRINELTKLYRDAAKTHHPDKGGNEEDFKVLNNIYKLLDPIIRKQKDASVEVSANEQNDIAQFLAQSRRSTQATVLNAISEVSSSLASSIGYLANKMRVRLARIASKELHYDYASFSGSRFHAFTASTKDMKTVDASLEGLKGDELKTAILINFKASLDSSKSIVDLEANVKKFKESDEYKVIKQSQGIASSIFRRETSSSKALNELIKGANERIEKEVTAAGATPKA